MRKYNIKKACPKDKKTDWFNMQVRKVAIPLSGWIAKNTQITPNQISFVAIIFKILSLIFFTIGGYWYRLIGVLCLICVGFVDHLDGKLARILNKTSMLGKWLDGGTDLVFLSLILLSVTIGLKAYTIGVFAVIAYPIHFMVSYVFKADFSDKLKTKIHLVKKESPLRTIYGGHTVHQLLPLACIFNVPLLLLWFFAIFGNLFWIAMLVMQFRTISNYEKNQSKS